MEETTPLAAYKLAEVSDINQQVNLLRQIEVALANGKIALGLSCSDPLPPEGLCSPQQALEYVYAYRPA